MIDLSQVEPFASGANRLCFRHPLNPALCLKVLRPEQLERRYRSQSPHKKLLGKQRLDDNRQEQRGYRQPAIASRLDGPEEPLLWQHLPRLYDAELTSLGLANVSDLVTDDGGQPGRTLEYHLTQGYPEDLARAVNRFCQWLLSTGILTRNLLPHNLVVSDRHGQPELFLVDGLGAPSIQALLARHPSLRNRAIQRKIDRFHRRIQWELNGRQQRWEEVQNR